MEETTIVKSMPESRQNKTNLCGKKVKHSSQIYQKSRKMRSGVVFWGRGAQGRPREAPVRKQGDEKSIFLPKIAPKPFFWQIWDILPTLGFLDHPKPSENMPALPTAFAEYERRKREQQKEGEGNLQIPQKTIMM